jgi:hypothetical protein
VVDSIRASCAYHEPALDEQENNLAAVAPAEEHPLSPTEERDTAFESRSEDASEADAVNRTRDGLNEDANEDARDATRQNTSRRTGEEASLQQSLQHERVALNRARHHVLCIAGRGPLDQLAAGLLMQVLGKHDLDCRVLPHEAASRTAIDTLDTSAVAIVCLFYLNIEGIPSHLRYLVKRVRQRLPHAAIVVGLWPQGQPETWSEDLQSAIGADCYATSMRDMLNACRRIAVAAPLQREPEPELERAVDGLAA